MTEPDANHLIRYCNDTMPQTLIEAYQVDSELAHRIGQDVLARAEALASPPEHHQDVLIAPFIEEAFDHEPRDASLGLKATVTLVVRNSLLEQAHHDGPLHSGIITITRDATGPLSHFLAARRQEPITYHGPNPFTNLSEQYPRAWACLQALTDAFAERGRHPLRLPPGPIPRLPTGEQVITTTEAIDDNEPVVFSAIDPRFDHHLIDLLRYAAEEPTVLYTSALSRYSRNSHKLHQILEYLLAHHATVLTTNYLIRPHDVWIRRGALVKPDSVDPYTGITDTRGLAGAHRKIAESVIAQHDAEAGT